VWYHHYLLLTVPGCIIAGVAVGNLLTRGSLPESRVKSAMNMTVRVATLLVTVALVAAFLRGEKREPSPLSRWSDRDRFVLELIKAYPKRSDVMVADRPMFAFAAGYEVPPNLAVISKKRLATHSLTVQEFIETIDRESPEHVILSWKLPDEFARRFAGTMRDRYRLVYADMEGIRLRAFVRGDIAGDPLPALLRAAERVPNVVAGHDAVGIEWARRGDTEQAIASFRRALALDHTAVRPCQHLADAYMAKGEYADGFSALQAGMQARDAARYIALARLYAWRRATCPDAAYRNGAEAQATADAISRLVKQPTLLDLETMAASLAAQGRFEAARTTAEAAMDRAQRAGQYGAMSRIISELESYRRSQAWTQPVRMPTS
jgi:tetratricopeptide (TPR) repeat protein